MMSADVSSSEKSPVLVQAVQWLDGYAESLLDLCEQHRLLLLGAVSFVYFAATSVLASRKPMWNDELFTYFIAQAPSLSGIWSALLTGADQNPFPFYVLTRWSLGLFGVNEWALRLPEMIGVWGAGVCLFHIVAHRSSSLYGFVAMIFLFGTGANFYSYEARPYGLVLAFASASWLSWQAATERRVRWLPLLGLFGSLAAALCSHYYAVLVFVPLGIAELVRSYDRRRVDWAIWLAMGGALSPLLVFIPVIEKARTYAKGFWALPSWQSIPETYSLLLMPAPLMLMLVLIFAGILAVAHVQHVDARASVNASAIPAHELAVALGYVSFPVIAVAVAMSVTGAFVPRYALPTVLGVSVLVAWTSARLLGGRALLGAMVLFLSCGGFVMLWARSLPTTPETALSHMYAIVRSVPESDLPVVVADPHNFMKLSHYAPRDLSSRFVYLADPDRSFRYLGHDTLDRGILDLRPWFHMNIQESEPYKRTEPRFLLYVHGAYLGGPWVNGQVGPSLNWIVSDLTATGWHLELKARQDNQLLFLVTRK
ncbi:MAG: glycosyltransferase family 39 protein [Nitrospirae bacterium]|nr:glycosyltransferase family 39 protein [Nitrospirota bacterium]